LFLLDDPEIVFAVVVEAEVFKEVEQ